MVHTCLIQLASKCEVCTNISTLNLGELPNMYRPGFIPFKPKTQPRDNLRSNKLPKIFEDENAAYQHEEFGKFVCYVRLLQV